MGSRPLAARAPGEVFRHRLREAREARGMSQRELVMRVNSSLGLDMKQPTVTRIERGERKVTLDEMVVFALALDVAPVHLLVPIDSDEPIRLAPNLEASPYDTRAWIRGAMPLFQDPRVYFSTVPRTEFDAAHGALESWQQQTPIQVRTDPEEE